MVSKQLKILWKVFYVLTALSGLNCGNLPAEIPKCNPGDGVCIAKTITDILHRYPKGNPLFGLPSVEAIQIEHAVVPKTPGDNPIQLHIQFDSLTANGIEGAIIDRVVGFEMDPRNSSFEVYGIVPNFSMNGNYQMEGKLIMIPIEGKGKAKIFLKNLKFGLKFKMAVNERNGKQYIEAKKIYSKTKTDLMKVDFENLFGPNKEVSDSINNVINDNWKDVWSDLNVGINNAVSDITMKLIENILSELSYDDFFKTE